MLDELIEEAWEEESAIVDMLNAGMNALTAVRPAIHSALMAWNSMSPEQKAYLINQAKIRLNQLGSNLSGKAHQVAMQAAGLIRGKGVPASQAVDRTVKQVVRQDQLKRRRLRPTSGKRRPSKKRRSRRVKRFESWE